MSAGAVAQDEIVSWDNPQIFFVYQANGKTADLTSLSRSVNLINSDGTRTNKVADSALNLTAAPIGTRIDTGIYHANFTAGPTWTAGTYEIVWTYTPVVDPLAEIQTASTLTATQRFEVLDKTKFSTGSAYVGYGDSIELKKFSPFDTKTLAELQVVIDKASRRIEFLTSRFFQPRYQLQKIDGRGSKGLLLGEPIIGISQVAIESAANGVTLAVNPVDLNAFRVRNRHLSGLKDPDDRDNPALEIARFEGIIFESLDTFPRGPETIHVKGVFGYTDPDGTPFGKTPEDLFTVVGNFALKFLQDPFGTDSTVWLPGNIASAKTRDQSIRFFQAGGLGTAGSVTGDPIVDQILSGYMRPPHYGSV